MLNERVQKKINEQINAELWSGGSNPRHEVL